VRIRQIGIIGALAALLVQPVSAQTPKATPDKPTPAMATTPNPAPASPAALVDINTASAADLGALPGIGKARSDAIIKGRPYKGKDDLLNRHILTKSVYDGIKDKIIAKQG
jgi:competence protein ComEA